MGSFLPPRDVRCGQPAAVALARIGMGAVRRRVPALAQPAVRIEAHDVVIAADLHTMLGLHLYRHGWCDPTLALLDELVPQGGVVVDGGANIGMFSLVAARRASRVVAVEASPATARWLRRNVALNAARHVEIAEVALSDAPGEVAFTALEAGSGISSLAVDPAADAIPVRATTLDELTDGWERVDLVKLDLEGVEVRALRGAARLLAEQRPALVLEIEPDHLSRQGASLAELESLLRGAGYSPYGIDTAGPAPRLVAWEGPLRRPDGEPNLVFRAG